MAEVLCPGPLTVESEFQIVPATSSHPAAMLTGACGPNAAASAARAAAQSSTTPTTLTVYRAMRGLSLGASNGVSNLPALEKTLTALGYHLAYPASGEGVQAFCARLAGHAAVVLEIANGQALRDELTGSGMDAMDLQYHFIALLGRNTGGASVRTRTALPAGYWVADGDNNIQNPVVNGRRVHRGLNGDLVYYSDTTVARAQPYGAFAVLPTGGTGGSGTVAGTTDYQAEAVRLWHELQADRQQIADLKAQNAALQQQVNDQYNQQIVPLRAQIADLKAQLAAAQQAGKADPVAAAALSALHSLKSALAEL